MEQVRKLPVVIGVNTGGRLGNHLYNYSWMIEIARRTHGYAINPAFFPYKGDFDYSQNQIIPFWASSGTLDYSSRLAAMIFTPLLLRAYKHIRITKEWRLDEWFFRQNPQATNNGLIGYIAYDWLVNGRHADQKLGPTFMHPDGSPDYFSDRVINYVKSKRWVIFDSAAIFKTFNKDLLEVVRKVFIPLPCVQERAKRFIQELREKHRVSKIIAVAIRQGDFKSWAGGSRYVSPQEFRAILIHLKQLYLPEKVAFALCSDEMLDASSFREVTAEWVPGGVMDHFSVIMQSDYAVGTKSSTFSEWACILGNTLLHPVSPGIDISAIGRNSFSFPVEVTG